MKKNKIVFWRKIIGSIIAFLLSALTILQAAISDGIFSRWYSIIIFIIMAIFLLGTMIYDIVECHIERNKLHVFEVGSDEFFDFFSKWYKRQGKLAIICDDLDWIANETDNRIYNILKQKSVNNQLTLFLDSGINSYYAKNLEQEGAILRKATTSIVSKYSFSCIAPMDHYSNIILRCKRNDNNQHVEFVEIEDEQIIDLINTILEEGQQSCQTTSKS